jgi:hypothetical protein
MSLTPINPDIHPNLPVQKRVFDEPPLKRIFLRNLDFFILSTRLVFQPPHHKRPLLLGQEARRLWKIVESEVSCESDEHGQYALQNKDPGSILDKLADDR